MNQYAPKISENYLHLQRVNCTENRIAEIFLVNFILLEKLVSNYFISNVTIH